MAAAHDLAGGLKGAGKGAKGCHWWVWIYVVLSFVLITIGAFVTGAAYWNHTMGHTLYAPCQPSLTVPFSSSAVAVPGLNEELTKLNMTYVPAWNITYGTGPNQCNPDYKDLAITALMIPMGVAFAGFWGLAWTAGKKYQNITHPIERGMVGPAKP